MLHHACCRELDLVTACTTNPTMFDTKHTCTHALHYVRNSTLNSSAVVLAHGICQHALCRLNMFMLCSMQQGACARMRRGFKES